MVWKLLDAQRRLRDLPAAGTLEAVCRIHFGLPGGAAWDPAWLGGVAHRLRDDFRGLTPQEVSDSTPGRRAGEPVRASATWMGYEHLQRPLFLQLAPGLLTVTELEGWPGLACLGSDLKQAWTQVVRVVEPAGVRKLSLGFTFLVPRTDPDEPLSAWIQGAHFPPFLLASPKPGTARLDWSPEPQLTATVTVGPQNPAAPEGGVTLALEAQLVTGLPVLFEPIGRQVERLHDFLLRLFEACLTPRYRAFVTGSRP